LVTTCRWRATGVVRQVLLLDALEFGVFVVRRLRRRTQQHQLESFKVHTSL